MAPGPKEDDTLAKLLLRQSSRRGDRPAIREKRRGIWHTMTWRDLADEAAALAGGLLAEDLQRGAYVALVGGNRSRLYAAVGATHWLGAVAVPLFQDVPAVDLAAALDRAGVTHVFAENQEQVDKLLMVLPRCRTVRRVVYDDERGLRHYHQPELLSYAALLERGREMIAGRRFDPRSQLEQGSARDTAFLFFTPGTAGPAKAVSVRHGALIERARAAAAADRLEDSDVAMAYLPPAWIGQMLPGYVQPMLVGYCVCCPESSETMLADMREVAPTYLVGTPRIFAALLASLTARLDETGRMGQGLFRRCMAVAQAIGPRLLAREKVALGHRLAYAACGLIMYGPLRDSLGMSRVRVAYSTGDAMAADLLTFFRALGINLKQLYGSTETLFAVAIQRDGAVRPGMVGPAVDGVELRLTQEREIVVRSRMMFDGYHGDPAATARARDAEGWFRTGDTGRLDEDGHLRVLDRVHDVGSLADGAPFAPRLVEIRLKAIPYIKDAVAFGVGRDRVSALIDIDTAAVGRWADRHSIPYTSHADLALCDEVQALVAEVIAEVNGELARDPALAASQVRRFVVLPRELSAEDGELTPTGKLRRGVITDRYRSLVDAMYDGHDVGRVETADSQDSVRTSTAAADVPIHDALTVAPATVRQAALA